MHIVERPLGHTRTFAFAIRRFTPAVNNRPAAATHSVARAEPLPSQRNSGTCVEPLDPNRAQHRCFTRPQAVAKSMVKAASSAKRNRPHIGRKRPRPRTDNRAADLATTYSQCERSDPCVKSEAAR